MSSQCRGGEVVVDAEVAFAAPSIGVEHNSSQPHHQHATRIPPLEEPEQSEAWDHERRVSDRASTSHG
jgi:hypothetical protein